MATNNKPVNQLRCGNIKATIWENVSEKGLFFSTTFSRPFKNQFGEWRNGTSFGLNDLEALMNVAFEAKEWIAAHVLKR
jgi:predicted 2-oxoglutarate/Fe(II)-dependent dioxygenase YbiX